MVNRHIPIIISLVTFAAFILLRLQDTPLPNSISNTAEILTEPDNSTVSPTAEAPSRAWQGAGLATNGSETASELEAFDRWARKLASSKDELTEAELNEGIRLAEARRPVLKQLIQDDPEAALQSAVPWTIRNQLPKAITDLLENRVSARADYSVLAAVPRSGTTFTGPAVSRAAVIDGDIYQANVYGSKEATDSKNALPVDGISIDEQLAILDATLRPLEPGEPIQSLPKSLISPEHKPDEDVATTQTWVYGGDYYDLCCSRHAAALGEELASRETSPGPQLAASGGSVSLPESNFEVGQSSWTEGTKSLLVIRVDFSDLTGPPMDSANNVIDAAYLTSRVNNEIAGWIDEVSYGKSSMILNSADVTAVLRMPQTAATYAVGDLNTTMRLEALAAAVAAGFTPENYDRVALVFNDLSSIPSSQITYGGLGQIGSSFTWYNGNFSFGIATHEFGHNYGLRHANRWQIPGASSNPVDAGGASVEYGDVFDIMGSTSSNPSTNADHFNPWFLNRLDWLTDSSIQNVTSGGTYRLYRYDHKSANASNALALKIDRSASENYWIGYRRKYAGDSSRGDVSLGACINWGYDFQTQSNLIDIDTPGTNPFDASLNVGNTFNDTDAGIQLTVTSAGGSGTDEYIDVAVSFSPRISFSQTSYDVDEASGNLAVVLTRSNNSNGAVSVTLSTSDDSAISPGDFMATSTMVSWADGDDAPKTVNIPIVPDSTTEGSESFNLHLTGISGGVILNESTVVANIREPGASDSGFSHGFLNASGSVRKMIVQPDGRIAFVGRASGVGGEAVNGIGRFESDGSLDVSYSTASSANFTPVYAIARQPDGKILVAGAFTTISGVTRNRVARLNVDGTLDSSFDPGTGPNSTVYDMTVRPDGRILIAGVFTSYNGTPRRGIAQLLPDGTLDTTFLATPLSGLTAFSLECLALQPDGKLLVGGSIYTSSFNGLFFAFSSGIYRLDTDGTIDTSFNIGSGAHLSGSTGSIRRVYSIAVQPDGKVIIGGTFTAFNGVDSNRVARLNSNGSVDTSFSTAIGSGADDRVQTIYIQGDGKILIGGWFSNVSGVSRPRLARLLSSGAFDSSFDASIPPTFGSGSTNYCYDVVMQPDTRVLVALNEFAGGQTGVKRVFSAQAAPSGQVEFAAGSTVVKEGNTANISVRRVGGSFGAISISYATIADTATTSDFVAQTGTLTWADGDTADKIISIDTTSDATMEPNEFFDIQLGIPIGGTSLAATALTSVTIEDPLPVENWRQTNFGSPDNSGTAANTFDADFDSVLNMVEYALGRSPNSNLNDDGSDALPHLTTTATDPLLIDRLVLVCDIPSPAPADVIYTVQAIDSLDSSSWTSLASKVGTGAWTWLAGGTPRIVETTAAGRSTVQIGDVTLDSMNPSRFMRLQIIVP